MTDIFNHLFSLVEKHDKNFDVKDEISKILSKNPHLLYHTKNVSVEYEKENFGSIETTRKLNICTYSRFLHKTDLAEFICKHRKKNCTRRKRSLSREKVRPRSRSRDLF